MFCVGLCRFLVDFGRYFRVQFWFRFSVDFSPLFGQRVACFTGLFVFGSRFVDRFWPNLWRTFHHPRVRVLGGLGRVSRRRGWGPLFITGGADCVQDVVFMVSPGADYFCGDL